MPKSATQGAAAGGGEGSQPASTTRGVTLQERASRGEQEQELSEENEALVPGLGDITAHLDTHGVKFDGSAPVQEIENQVEELQPASEDTDETAQAGETEEEAQQEEEDGGKTAEEEEQQDEELVDHEGRALPPEVQEKINKRIGELTREKHTLKDELAGREAKIAELEQQVSQAGAAPIRLAPSAAMPLADVTSPAELTAKVREANEAKAWCIEHAEGAEVVKNAETGETEFVDAERVRKIHAAAERTLAAVPERQEYLARKTEADEVGRKVWPDLFKSGTPENQQLQGVRRAFPWLAAFPDGDLIIAQAMEGKKVMDARLASSQKPAPKPAQKPPHNAPAPKPAPRVPRDVVEQRSASADLNKSLGSSKAVQKFAESLV